MNAAPPSRLASNVALAPLTTLGLGGSARCFVDAVDDASLRQALAWAAHEARPVVLLGGGSNVIVPDAGLPGLVIALRMRGISSVSDGDRVHVTAAAGEPWDDFVAHCVSENLAGLECLSGIPGLVGATPIQNVGAYGQEVSSTVASVRVLDRSTLQERVLSNAQCDFSYRYSALKREPARYAVLAVTFALHKGGAPWLRYQELTQAFGALTTPPSLAQVRRTVIALRRNKGMVFDPTQADDTTRSAGSFFLNPIIPAAQAEALAAQHPALPRYPASNSEMAKLAAAWLIEAAGFRKGERRGAVGISSKHALALVCHEGATVRALLEFANEIEGSVHARFGVRLEREPVLLM